MKILLFNKTLLQLLGLWPVAIFPFVNHKIIRHIWYMIITFIILATFVPSLIFAITNMQDVVAFTDAAYVCITLSTSLWTFWSLVNKRNDIRIAIEFVQETIDESEKYIQLFLRYSFRNYLVDILVFTQEFSQVTTIRNIPAISLNALKKSS